jgi:tetratricopeptide (TPR) repeat protein
MRCCFLLLLLFASIGLALAQQAPSRLPAPPDSLRAALRAAPAGAERVQALLRVARAFSTGGDAPDSVGALGYGRAAIALSRQLGDSLLVGQVYDQQANYYLGRAQIGTAGTCLRRATPLLRTAMPAVRARLEYHLAWLSEEQAQPKLAQQHYRQAINLYRAAHKPAQEAESVLFLGRMLQNGGQLDSALVYIFRALAIYQQVRDTASIAVTMTNVSSILNERNDLAGANYYLKQAYRLGKQIGDITSLIPCLNGLAINASYVDSMALYYRYMGQSMALSRQQHLALSSNQCDYLGHFFEASHPDSAIYYCLKAIQLGEREHEPIRMQGQAMINLAFIYQRLGQAVPAATWARKALALKQPYPTENYTAAALTLLAKQARAHHDYRLAYDLLAQGAKLRLAVEARRHTALAERVRARYEVGQAEQQVRFLTQDRELARLRRQQEWAGGLGLLTLVLGTGGWSLNRYRRRQRGRETAIRTRLAADLHDDVGSLLTQISLESSWLRSGSRSPEQLAPHLDHLAAASRRAAALGCGVGHRRPQRRYRPRARTHARPRPRSTVDCQPGS